jgi:hypothetical protein
MQVGVHYTLDIGGVLVTKEEARVAFKTETRRNIGQGLIKHIKRDA